MTFVINWTDERPSCFVLQGVVVVELAEVSWTKFVSDLNKYKEILKMIIETSRISMYIVITGFAVNKILI